MAESDSPSPELRLAVIGAGRWGRNLIRVARDLPGARLRMVCDLEPERLREAAAPGVVLAPACEAAFVSPDVDAVLLSTPAAEHARMAIAALGAGKHVFVEKPMALRVTDAEAVARAAASARKTVFVGHIVHYDPAHARLRALLASGALGRVRALYGLRHAESVRGEAGGFWALGPHDVSFVLRCTGALPRRLSAVRRADADRTVATLGFDRSVSAVIDVCGASPVPARLFVAAGSEGAAVIDASGPRSRLQVLRGRSAARLASAVREASAGGDLGALPGIVARLGADAPSLSLPWVEPLHAELLAFTAAVTRGAPFPTTVMDGVEVTRVMAAVEAAAIEPVSRLPGRCVDEPGRLTVPAGP